MLKDVSPWFVGLGNKVSVIGKSKNKHLDLVKESANPEFINSLIIDYVNLFLFEKIDRNAIENFGPISRVVSWTPSLTSFETVYIIVSELISD
ncbi:hypothetical protein [Bacillus sp. 2205SS5-2]|uniref:hypothetical protein n=1 Tax=Bacillus sp. 2205SS5-2 TaxID=3109031 RepID=UPI003004A4D2